MKRLLISGLVLILAAGCGMPSGTAPSAGHEPAIFPDYSGVTVPANIAPLHFCVTEEGCEGKTVAEFSAGGISASLCGRDGVVSIGRRQWKKLLKAAEGDFISVKVSCRDGSGWKTFDPFRINVSKDPVDKYLTYRLIEPGYEVWNEMGLYMRDLESYRQTPLLKNRSTGFNCINCHSFCMQDASRMVFHMRAAHGGTYLLKDGNFDKLNVKTTPGMVYPGWHPGGRFIAFSLNDIKQLFHTSDRNRVEVYDLASDVVVYDSETNEVLTSPEISSKAVFETFPAFAPDGKTLYYCSADTLSMPERYDEVRYRLCSIGFDEKERSFGSVDTLYTGPGSVSFPRVSPDGKYLLCTIASYGNFSIWHQDADLRMIDLSDREREIDMSGINSGSVDSYHSWSSNSRWAVVSSRRIDGLYTRPFIAHVNGDGTVDKAFLLPQKDPRMYHDFMKSFNIPEFTRNRVKIGKLPLEDSASPQK